MVPMIPTLTQPPSSLLAQELGQEIGALVEDFRRRKPGVQEWEIQAGLALAAQDTAPGRARAVALSVGLSIAAALIGLAVFLSTVQAP